MLQAVVSLAAVVFVVVNLVADLVYPLLDPRVRSPAAPGDAPVAGGRPEIRSDLQRQVSIHDRRHPHRVAARGRRTPS